MLQHTPLSAVFAMAWYDTSGGLWTKMSLRSFRKYFPTEELIVVNNNRYYATDEMRSIVSEHASSITERIPLSSSWSNWNPHGRAIDLVLQICRRNNYDILILIEPDCLFKGRIWADNLIAALSTYKLAGSYRVQYGPIHPGLSAWNVKDVPTSFNARLRHYSDPIDEKFSRNLHDWLNRCTDPAKSDKPNLEFEKEEVCII